MLGPRLATRMLVLATALLVTCTDYPDRAPARGKTDEAGLRAALGIPAGARTVIVINHSSHLDIDWLMTFEDYYTTVVRDVLYQSLTYVDRWPGRSNYAMAEMGFLRRFMLDLSADDRIRLREAILRGQWHIVGGGVSSPDEILPLGEALVRDWGHGNRWAEETLGTRANSAWTPDSFGHSPATPAILRHLGLNAIGFSRIPGSPAYPGRELARIGDAAFHDGHDLDGSVSTRFRRNGTQALRWRAQDGSEVLGMWMPWLYCQGDFIDKALPLLPGLPTDTDMTMDDILDRMAQKVDELSGFVAAGGYAFLPVGCDFQAPMHRLPQYVADWNRKRYPRTGVWLIQDTLDTYANLVRFHWDELPVETVDLNPVFTGFYGQRPWIKQSHRRLTGLLQNIEALRVLTGAVERDQTIEELWWLVGMGDHHDWIPGTSLDHVYTQEQVAQFARALSAAEGLQAASLSASLAALSLTAGSEATPSLVVFNAGATQPIDPVVWRQSLHVPGARSLELLIDGHRTAAACDPLETFDDGSLRLADCAAFVHGLPAPGFTAAAVVTAPVAPEAPMLHWWSAAGAATAAAAAVSLEVSWRRSVLQFAADRGWALVRWRHDGTDLIAPGGAADLRLADDNGGLYRMGGELPQCTWELRGRQADMAATITAASKGTHAEATVRLSGLEATAAIRWQLREDGALEVDLVSDLPRNVSALFGMDTNDAGDTVTTGVPYGVAIRPRDHFYTPSFWPVANWIDGGSLAVISSAFAGWRLAPGGRLETFVQRNTSPREECAALGAAGTADGPGGGTLTIIPHPGRGWHDADIARRALSMDRPPIAIHAATPPSGALPRIDVTGDFAAVALEPIGDAAALRLWSPTGAGQAAITATSLRTLNLAAARTELAYRRGVPDDAGTILTAGGLALRGTRSLIQVTVPRASGL